MYRLHLSAKSALIVLAALGFLLAAAHSGYSQYHNPAVPGGEDSAAYWMDRGGMLATYGNYPAAVKAYEKALAIDPGKSEVYFDMGVAYGEMADFTKALTNIDKAVSLDPQNGRYVYGRGWVLLMTGRTADAMAAFAKAADMGNPDAQSFLNR